MVLLVVLVGVASIFGAHALSLERGAFPLGVTASHPMSASMARVDRWRNRTIELFERAHGIRQTFSPDIDEDISSDHSANVFERIYRRLQSKLATDTGELISDSSGESEDDYSSDGMLVEGGRKQPFTFSPCSPKQCSASFNTKGGVPFKIPCSVASAFMPEQPQLPLTFPGNYDMCQTFDFAGAHFCTIQTGFIVAPLLAPNDSRLIPAPKDFVLIGGLLLGKCVQDICESRALKTQFLKGLKARSWKLFFGARRVRLDILAIESIIEETTQVHCVRESAEMQGDEHESMGTMLFFFLVGFLIITGVTGTILGMMSPNTHNKVILSFSLPNNIASLYSPMRGEFVFLNGVRVISMLWVVYGHTVLMSSAVGMNLPLANPTSLDTQTQSFSMTFIRSGEYSVDTFFFMSGLLAAHGIVEALHFGRFPGGLRLSSYLSLFFVRFLRLTPVYMFVLLFYTKAFPYCGSGPYWHMNASREMLENSCRNWFTNLFYFNNLYPFGVDGGVGVCMGWTWYLANDMQFFMIVPFLAALFISQFNALKGTSAGPTQRAIRLYGPCIILIIAQVASTAAIMDHYEIATTFDPKFSAYVYVKPWCRISPYIIGCMLAMYRFTKRNEPKTAEASEEINGLTLDKSWSNLWYVKHIVAGAGISILLFIAFVIYNDFKCKAEPKSDCGVPGAFIEYGALAPGNWSRATLIMYVSLGYPAWGFALAILVNYAANGYGGVVTRFLALPVFLPLARLSYTVYLIHLICMQWFYAKSPAMIYASPARQVMDSIGFAGLAFAIAFLLYILVEKPFTNLLPYCFGFDKEEKRSQRTRATSTPLDRELSFVSDVDSEAVIISSPGRRASVDLQEPLIATLNGPNNAGQRPI